MRSLSRARVFVCLVLVATGAFAQAPDAPLQLLDAVAIVKDQPAPADGVFLTTDKAAQIVKSCKTAELENNQLKAAMDAQLSPVWLVVGGGVIGILVGGLVVALVKK